MGATVVDVAREFQGRLRKFDALVASAFVEYTKRGEILLCALLDQDDPDADLQLAQMQLELEEMFPDHPFQFSTIHLRSREPEQFIPKDALVVVSARARADAR